MKKALPRQPSKLEQRFALALTAWGEDLPPAQQEYRFHPTRRWRFDFAWPNPTGHGGVAVELDGGTWMIRGGRHGGVADKEKINTAGLLGWRVLNFTADELKDSRAAIERLRVALRYGWLAILPTVHATLPTSPAERDDGAK